MERDAAALALGDAGHAVSAKRRRILAYHVVPGRVSASEVVKLRSAKAVRGDTIDITADGPTVMVDSARVLKTDVGASNGIIHVIDAVILPDEAGY